MLFSNLEFYLIFLPFLGLWKLLVGNLRHLFLFLFGLYLYSTFDYRFIPILFISIFVDYWVGKKTFYEHNKTKAKRYLFLSLFTNLGLLAFFKYLNPYLGQNAMISTLIPLGISFYTFQTLSYTIDCYRKKITPCENPLHFALYVSFFPQLIAGPIERASNLLPQLIQLNPPNKEQIKEAIDLILWAIVKKTIIAVALYKPVESLWRQENIQLSEMLLTGLLMTLTVYCDFSAYSEIARGIAKLLGVELTINYRPFYRSRNPSEFWKSWHISLGTWIHDYMFIPLIKTPLGRAFPHLSLFLVMIVIGIWHGNTLNWIVWGAYAGLFASLFRLVAKSSWTKEIPSPLKGFSSYFFMLMMYMGLGLLHQLQFAQSQYWILNSLSNTQGLGVIPEIALFLLPYLGILWVYEFLFLKKNQDLTLKSQGFYKRSFIWGVLLGLIALLGEYNTSPFIYFEF